ncbi:hypothetical protein [Agrobacterium vaccinii]|uniref:hypothetical protein n=1 Tax=Agrobacterium vaccinii TaxID=2735528 RepID=UPI001E28AE35|nr:hypothetical protein [Agrobacterium vaccinii]UHS58203.1 hypothetical protein HRS00_20485 [Agrobacterium vaccinii]
MSGELFSSLEQTGHDIGWEGMEFEKISIGLKTHNGTELELGTIAVETTDDPALLKVLSFVDSAMSGVGAFLPSMS